MYETYINACVNILRLWSLQHVVSIRHSLETIITTIFGLSPHKSFIVVTLEKTETLSFRDEDVIAYWLDLFDETDQLIWSANSNFFV